MPSKGDSPEVAIAKLAVLKIDLDRRLHEVRAELRRAAAHIDLPIAVELDDHAVLVKKPTTPGGLPLVVTAPLFRRSPR